MEGDDGIKGLGEVGFGAATSVFCCWLVASVLVERSAAYITPRSVTQPPDHGSCITVQLFKCRIVERSAVVFLYHQGGRPGLSMARATQRPTIPETGREIAPQRAKILNHDFLFCF